MKSKQKRAWMTPSEVSLFCQQVELLLQSGIPLYEGMRSLADNYQSTPYREALTELAQKVDETGSLYEGMRESPLFPAYVREMVRLGERLGELENVCHGLATYYEREDISMAKYTFPLEKRTLQAEECHFSPWVRK